MITAVDVCILDDYIALTRSPQRAFMSIHTAILFIIYFPIFFSVFQFVSFIATNQPFMHIAADMTHILWCFFFFVFLVLVYYVYVSIYKIRIWVKNIIVLLRVYVNDKSSQLIIISGQRTTTSI